MKENHVKRDLAGGAVRAGSFVVDLCGPGIPRVLAAAGDRFVIVDQEHTAWTVDTIRPMLAGCHAAGVVPLVRVPATAQHMIAAALDAGAMGIVVPMVESAAQARTIVDAARYPPQGRRGLGPLYADELDADLPSTLARMNAETLLIAMVETAAGVQAASEIAGVEGIDALWVGHGDLTSSLGIPGAFGDERFHEALERILAAATAHGKPVGIMATSPEEARERVARGFRLIGLGDRALFERALRAAHAALSEA
jgi:2-keto-3-deoxy-L-rhamnonate aldolase RhmA